MPESAELRTPQRTQSSEEAPGNAYLRRMESNWKKKARSALLVASLALLPGCIAAGAAAAGAGTGIYLTTRGAESIVEGSVEEVERRPAFKARLLRYAEARMVMLGQTAACNVAHRITERLARWLLISHDSVGGQDFILTHEFLSHMLGAERPSVTVAAGALQKTGAMTYRRGTVQVRDRARLERAACGHASLDAFRDQFVQAIRIAIGR